MQRVHQRDRVERITHGGRGVRDVRRGGGRRRAWGAIAVSLAAVLAVVPALSLAEEVKQDVDKGDKLVVTDASQVPERVVQAGRSLKAYEAMYDDVGLHFRTGTEINVDTDLIAANAIATTIMGAHGKGTHVRYTGHWQGDASGGYPYVVLTDHGKMTWEAEAVVDLVMESNFFTRQIWLHGDGTGTLELAEGFIADRTEDATVPNAMGTIRLGGATLITHHSQSLPYNARPDGRGGLYHNGHVVFEHQPGSTWIIKSNHQVYSAQIDFRESGTIDCQAPLTHNGRRRICDPVGNGGKFMSTGSFRTIGQDITITKTGPAMLSLEGQQAYMKGAKLHIKEGQVRIYTDPGDGDRVQKNSGPYLEIVVEKGAKLVLAAPLMRIKSLHLKEGAEAWLEPDTKLQLGDKLTIDEGATLHKQGDVAGEIVGKTAADPNAK